MITYKDKPNDENELFNILHPVVKSWFKNKFNTFSLPQLYGVMEVHSRNNVLISAPTGATKTLTGFTAIINELIDSSLKGILEDKVYCVYISPLKALNNDIQKNLLEPLEEMEKIYDKLHIDKVAKKNLGIRIAVRTGDTTQKEKSYMLKNSPHILITTPESLAILLNSIKFKDYLKDVQWCIIDEIHALADNKRGVHLSLSLERLQKLSPGMTRIGLSATISPLDEIARFLVGNDRSCKIIDTQFLKQLDLKVISPVDDLIDTSHSYMHHEMYKLLDKLIQEHKTTLIFTNTRSGTERVVHYLKEKFPKNYTENIGAHHGSLSKDHRLRLEERLRKGELKVVVSSTSLELGIDIGYIDLVILLGSPKSVARALQRIGRSGHQLHSVTKGRIVVLDRDDLIECSLLLKSAIEKKIDKIHIPTNALDVLSQQIFGIAISDQININDLFNLIKKSYCYKTLNRKDFNEVIEYLAGKYTSLEDRHIYAKIWHDEETGMIGRKGRLARVLYMTNIGTIPDEAHVLVKVGEQTVGTIDEAFLERLRRGDIFVLGGNTYEFKFSRGMVAQVQASVDRPPTVPSWFSDTLPLSFDLALEIQRFRKLMEQRFSAKHPKKEIIKFINEYLYVDDNSANAIYNYFYEQFNFSEIPHENKIVIENYIDEHDRKYIIFHSLFGRRVNDVLSRALAYAVYKTQHRDVELGINDNGFYLAYEKNVNVMKALSLLNSKELRRILELAIDQTEVLKRRFRHCAMRSLMILRSYKGRTKKVGRQQVSSMILLNAVKRISEQFIILKEARREVLEDLMDIDNSINVIKMIEDKKIKLKEVQTRIPSPFALNLVMQGYADILKADDKVEFLKKMHQQILAKISLKH
ncbi:ATP-dependent helicase [Candidatus Woesearchaeota archaeon]|nr:ATP-dependent helicase [Candidatus Woesearchaeota archaeon]